MSDKDDRMSEAPVDETLSDDELEEATGGNIGGDVQRWWRGLGETRDDQ